MEGLLQPLLKGASMKVSLLHLTYQGSIGHLYIPQFDLHNIFPFLKLVNSSLTYFMPSNDIPHLPLLDHSVPLRMGVYHKIIQKIKSQKKNTQEENIEKGFPHIKSHLDS
jgi:hypothetical protein